ncbi:cysteine methyltransferase [Oceanisphaera profunda]|uniref:Cysteine methyltransferase n=1 Tax=Oceanisphaera profunda TaxID=1416627 RepID=A0A1Y0D8R7_9GAMM|nr:MGMT family protein [Oceanisphaera profunda]ART83577.1 cysteine methyltransferase [Oceanisphaera profunda]
MSAAQTASQTKILKLLALVPQGYVVSYGQLADLAGLPGRARLVGHTLRNLDVAALPWHRVVGADGRISLPKGSPAWLEQRQRLLAEGITFKGHAISGNCVNMREFQWQPDLAAMLMLFDF